MKQVQIGGKLTAIVILSLLMSGCLCVEVIEDVGHPGTYFRKARHEIERIQRCRGRCPEQMHILVYDKDERKIVRITVPVWLVEGCSDLEHWIDRGKDEFDLKIRYDFDGRKFRNLKRRRAGFLAEVNDRGSRVLVWLE